MTPGMLEASGFLWWNDATVVTASNGMDLDRDIDYFLVSNTIKDRVIECTKKAGMGSAVHSPVRLLVGGERALKSGSKFFEGQVDPPCRNRLDALQSLSISRL